MVKIETKIVAQEAEAYCVEVAYEESEEVLKGEYLVIMDRIKKVLLEKTDLEKEQLKEILFD